MKDVAPRFLTGLSRVAMVCGCITVAMLLFGAPGNVAAAEAKRQFNVPAGEAEKTLRLFSEQAGVHLLFPTDLVEDVRTRAVAGDHDPRQALAIMLTRTGIVAIHDEKTGFISLRRVRSAAAPAASDVARVLGTPIAAAPGLEMIELSPFTVTSGRDVGYLAANALSGSRMDIRLKDTAASISVLTEEFMKDLGATDLAEALVYGNNTTLDLGEAGEFGSGQESNALVEFEKRYRVRGLPATIARNYFKWSVPADAYNIARVEESRGPNSILFGVGSAGGIINVSTKQAWLAQPVRTALLTVGSHDSRRAALDLNQPLAGGVAALRLNALWDRTHGFRHHTFAESRRIHLAAKYRPAATTQIRVEVERGTIEANVPRTGALTDRSLPWIAAGRPTFAPAAVEAEFAAYGVRLGADQLRYVSNLGRLIHVGGQILTTSPGPPVEITDPRHTDPSINTGGPGQRRTNRFDVHAVHLEQQLGRSTFAELSYQHQYYRFASYDPINSAFLLGDPNRFLPGGAGENPFAGASLLETNWRLFRRNERASTFRLSLSHEWKAGRIGRYRVALLGEHERSRWRNRNAFESWEGRPFNPTPENGANRVTRRTYVTPNDWSTYHVNGPASTGLLRNVLEPVSGRTLSSTWIPADGVNDDLTTNRSVLAGLQAGYFGGRLVVGAGYRADRIELADRGIARDPVTQVFGVDYSRVNVIKAAGRTATVGLVGHIAAHLSLLYNQSRNIDLPNPGIRVLPDVGVGRPPRGEGRDFGFAWDLLEGRIYARAIRFTTTYEGEIGFGGLPVFNTTAAILNAARTAELISQAEYDARALTGMNGRTRDKATEGFEFSVTANPTAAWRLQASWSITDGRESRIVPEVVAWWAEARPYFERFPPGLPTGVGVNTIATTIQNFQDTLANWRSAEGIGLVGNRRHKANLFARHAFQSGLLKGAYVGGGYRYLGPMLVGRTDGGALQFAPGYGEGSLVAGRIFRLRHGRELRLQLNVTNLFDESEPIIVRYRSSGNPTQIQQVILRSPPTWRLTTEYSF